MTDKTENNMSAFQIMRFEHAKDLSLPTPGTYMSAGYDLSAALEEDLILAPGQRALIPCGFAIALAPGYEGQIRSRSGLAYKHGIVVLNAPGTIDADYRGELKVILMNHSDTPFTVTPGMRVAQLVIARFVTVQWHEVDMLEEAPTRDAAGFGSTGLHAKGK
ncbi:MAG: dUTP diphosphatase [Candidatus Puniceispirillum sp.]|nr:dUTP diphosphatase [Candidatus Puniceispirillum sp.]